MGIARANVRNELELRRQVSRREHLRASCSLLLRRLASQCSSLAKLPLAPERAQLGHKSTDTATGTEVQWKTSILNSTLICSQEAKVSDESQGSEIDQRPRREKCHLGVQKQSGLWPRTKTEGRGG